MATRPEFRKRQANARAHAERGAYVPNARDFQFARGRQAKEIPEPGGEKQNVPEKHGEEELVDAPGGRQPGESDEQAHEEARPEAECDALAGFGACYGGFGDERRILRGVRHGYLFRVLISGLPRRATTSAIT